MNTESIETVGVVGAGTMGLGIAQLSAMAGFETILFDVNSEMLQKALVIIENNLNKGIERGKLSAEDRDGALSNIRLEQELTKVKADIIVEAIVENLAIKQSVFNDLEKVNKKETILASNTSSIPITQIAAKLQHPERFVGMHFFNPAHIMKLVEIISGVATSKEVADTIEEFAKKLGKSPVRTADSPGFIVNRVARHFYLEGLKLAEEGVADFETIDELIESSGFKMGPFKLMDLIGVDTNYSVTTTMFNAFHYDAKFRPNRIQQQKVDAGHYGRKSGKGFYSYDK